MKFALGNFYKEKSDIRVKKLFDRYSCVHQNIYIILFVLLIFFTRLVSLEHGMFLHSDEYVFYNAAASLKDYVLGNSPVYSEIKEYPEGAIVMYLPFHIAAAAFSRLTGLEPVDIQLLDRIASVIYFTLGSVCAALIVHKFFSKKPAYIIASLLISTFSIMHIEQSRYGTGDAISFLLLSLVVYLSASSLDDVVELKRKYSMALTSFFLCGVICAVKYPLIYFALIPAYTGIALLQNESTAKKWTFSLAFIFATLLGFAVFSPKAVLDPMYIVRCSQREISAYIKVGNTEMGGFANHILQVLIYSLFYSGFPLMPLFFAFAVREIGKKHCDKKLNGNVAVKSVSSDLQDKIYIFFGKFLPVLILIFAMYNLLVKNLYMRTLYPFFFLTDIYVAVAIGRYYYSGGAKKYFVLVLAAFCVLRGAWLVYALSDDTEQDRLAAMINETVDENWQYTTGFNPPFIIMPSNFPELKNNELSFLIHDRWAEKETAMLREGELLVTGAMDFSAYTQYILPLKSDESDPAKEQLVEGMRRWELFKKINKEYYVDRVYPEYYYYLFGSWIKGTSLTEFEFPTTYLYYRG